MGLLDLPAVVRPPAFPAASYFYFASPAAAATNAALGIGTLRLLPWRLDRPMSLARLGAEVTTVGEAGSKYRIGIYADTGSSYPGTLVVDAGQIAGDSATVQELTVSVTLAPGVYWVGGVVQTVTTTQPTIRTTTGWHPAATLLPVGTSLPGVNGASVGLTIVGSITGALPGTFPGGAVPSGSAPRIFGRSA